MTAREIPLPTLAPGLQAGRDGIFFAGSSAPLSYPEEGNRAYFSIEEGSFWFAHRNRCIAAAAEAFVPERFLVDVGGGNGVVASFLQERGFRTVLVEPGIEGCVNARKRGLEEVLCGTLEAAGFVPESLPAIGCFDVVEHLENESAFFAACRLALAPGGKLLLTVPAFSFLWSHEDDLAGHFRRYRLARLREIVEAAGFTVRYATYFFSLLAPAIVLGRVLPYRLGKRRARVEVDALAREHASSAAKGLGSLLGWEQAQIRRQRSISCGSSCLLVATRR
jgi:hypothetical protein